MRPDKPRFDIFTISNSDVRPFHEQNRTNPEAVIQVIASKIDELNRLLGRQVFTYTRGNYDVSLRGSRGSGSYCIITVNYEQESIGEFKIATSTSVIGTELIGIFRITSVEAEELIIDAVRKKKEINLQLQIDAARKRERDVAATLVDTDISIDMLQQKIGKILWEIFEIKDQVSPLLQESYIGITFACFEALRNDGGSKSYFVCRKKGNTVSFRQIQAPSIQDAINFDASNKEILQMTIPKLQGFQTFLETLLADAKR